ncbi:MAG: hypothetical protein Q7T99_17140 [Pseudomonas sp.]|nr:hypothetical protein [Pseudomonas sp.]
MKSGNGPDNLLNLLMYAPGGKKHGMQLIPTSEVPVKDDFTSINNISRDELLAAPRIPIHLVGIVPQKVGGFGSKRDAAEVWAQRTGTATGSTGADDE